jgi:hypothetical protein
VNGHELSEQLYVPTNFYPPRLAASIVVPGHILVYGYEVYNSNGSTQYVLMFDASALPADAAVPILAQNAATKTLVGNSWTPQGREFLEGFVLCNSSTDTAKTIGAADCFFDVQYAVLG